MGISTFITLMIIYSICSLCLGYNKGASALRTSSFSYCVGESRIAEDL